MSFNDLLSAASVGNLHLLNHLLDNGLSPGAATAGGWTALHAAAMAGQLQPMRLLILRGAPVDASTVHGCAPLHSASRTGQLQAMQLLLIAGANVNIGGPKDTPLFKATLYENFSVVHMLLRAGAELQHAFILAVVCGHHQLVRLFIRRGADVNGRWNRGSTALHTAAYRNHMKVVQELLVNGAEINAVDTLGETVLHRAAVKGSCEVVQLLLANEAKVNAQTMEGVTALHIAAWRGREEAVKLLLASGADLHLSQITTHHNPLHAAADAGHAGTVALLLSAGANPRSKSSSGLTAMHHAAYHGHVDIVQQLLNFGAVWRLVDNFGKTALTLASSKGHMEVVELLVGVAADSQQVLLGAAQAAAGGQHWHVWAFLVRSIHSRHGNAVEHCLPPGLGVNMAAAVKALAGGWQEEVDRHKEVLGAARRERDEGEEAKCQAQQLLIQTALLHKHLERSRPRR